MHILLTKRSIDAAIPKIAKGLEQYLWLQSKGASLKGSFDDAEFRRKYNHFYRVRRSAIWQDVFYELMARAKKERLRFHAVLELLHQATGRYEASFASKLFATLNPSAPVVDSVVLKNLGLRLPYGSASGRADKIAKLHEDLACSYAALLKTENGRYLVSEFKRAYPTAKITEEKMLDLVLWQTRV